MKKKQFKCCNEQLKKKSSQEQTVVQGERSNMVKDTWKHTFEYE
jgi:hypothetical protein